MVISIHALREEGDTLETGHYDMMQNFYPRPPRGGRLVPNRLLWEHWKISIHALREEGDIGSYWAFTHIDTRFLSTPSARRATKGPNTPAINETISIHALREEGDSSANAIDKTTNTFLSTPSARRATFFVDVLRHVCVYFYPRPPRGGRPPTSPSRASMPGYFYPRPPRGGRPAKEHTIQQQRIFLSTPSARRATPGQ